MPTWISISIINNSRNRRLRGPGGGLDRDNVILHSVGGLGMITDDHGGGNLIT